MARFCNHFGKIFLGTFVALCAVPVQAETVDLNMLITSGTIPGLETEVQVTCQGDLALNLETEAGLQFTTTQCAFIEGGAVDFSSLAEVDLGLQIDFTNTETGDNFNFPARITNGEGPIGEEPVFNLVLGSFTAPDPVEDEPEDPVQEEDPTSTPTNTDIDVGDIFVTENDCAFARNNDPGIGVYEPGDNCPDGPKIIVYDGSNGKDTEVPGCIANPSALPNECRGNASITGQTIYSQRFKMQDLGKSKEILGSMQVTTINTMIGDNVSALKNVIISISENPGAFNSVGKKCKDVTASENSDFFITQAGSNIALENPGKYCELVPGQMYYVNTRHDGGDSINCGINGTCQHTVVDRTVDPS